MRVLQVIQNIESKFNVNILKGNKEVVFISVLIVFPILMRILPFTFIAITATLVFLIFIFSHFYKYSSKFILSDNKFSNTKEYSWGFVNDGSQTIKSNELINFFDFLKTKDITYYKNYFYTNKLFYIFTLFIIGDLIVAFKNLPLSESGVYFALSLFTKFVFLAYFYIGNGYNKILEENIAFEDKQTKILDNFYKHFNGLASVSVVLFILFFILSKYIVEIFFGASYYPYHTSLPFILFANIATFVSLIIFRTAMIIESERTNNVLKVFIPLFILLFVFMDISYYDTVAYFVIGAVSVLSIFLYNFCIRKPAYIESTYNSLF